jgi:hypothetical protein
VLLGGGKRVEAGARRARCAATTGTDLKPPMPVIDHQIELAEREYEWRLFTWYRAIEANQVQTLNTCMGPAAHTPLPKSPCANVGKYICAFVLLSLCLKAVLRLS